jgi:hypothetical protein
MKSKNSPKKARQKSVSGENNHEFSANKDDSGIQSSPDSPLNNEEIVDITINGIPLTYISPLNKDGTGDFTHNRIYFTSVNPSEVDNIIKGLDQLDQFKKKINSRIKNKDTKFTIHSIEKLLGEVKSNMNAIIDDILLDELKKSDTQILSPKKTKNTNKKTVTED